MNYPLNEVVFMEMLKEHKSKQDTTRAFRYLERDFVYDKQPVEFSSQLFEVNALLKNGLAMAYRIECQKSDIFIQLIRNQQLLIDAMRAGVL